jgi:hypothetical protein
MVFWIHSDTMNTVRRVHMYIRPADRIVSTNESVPHVLSVYIEHKEF